MTRPVSKDFLGDDGGLVAVKHEILPSVWLRGSGGPIGRMSLRGVMSRWGEAKDTLVVDLGSPLEEATASGLGNVLTR